MYADMHTLALECSSSALLFAIGPAWSIYITTIYALGRGGDSRKALALETIIKHFARSTSSKQTSLKMPEDKKARDYRIIIIRS